MKNKFKLITRLFNYFYQFKSMLLLAIFLSFSSNLLALLGPILSGLAIDAIGINSGEVIFEKVFYYCSLMIIFFVLSSLLTYFLSIVMLNFSRKITKQMRGDVFNRLLDLPINFFDTNQTGDIISRISYDIDTINATLSNDIVQLSSSLITVIGSFIMMLVISFEMTFIFILTIPISLMSAKHMSTKVKPLFKARSAKLGELNGFSEEITTGLKTINIYHQQIKFIEKFDLKNEEAVEAYYQADYHSSSIGPMVNFVNNLSLSLISVVGALNYLFGNVTLGNLSSFILYSRKFSGPINEMANIISELQSALAASRRVFNLIDETTETKDIINAYDFENVQGNINLENINFSYVKDKLIIKDLNLNIKKGSLIAIVGPTGAGKTTLINLLMRFYDPDSGEIKLDGINIKNATRNSLRKSYAMVLQDTWLFTGTVFDNIAYGKKDATLDEVIEVAKAAKIHNYIISLPNGYDTLLNEQGMNISQGQKQLLTIARAMLLDAKLLILDEATSNVDTQTELQIQESMLKLMKNKTCFVIAHRLSTIKNADEILVVNNGNIVEMGNHEKLLEQDGVYAKMYQAQFESY